MSGIKRTPLLVRTQWFTLVRRELRLTHLHLRKVFGALEDRGVELPKLPGQQRSVRCSRDFPPWAIELYEFVVSAASG